MPLQSWASAGGKKQAFAPLEIGPKN